jgi:multidrug efflux pump subunit AcrA (membrane-fusion protein)
MKKRDSFAIIMVLSTALVSFMFTSCGLKAKKAAAAKAEAATDVDTVYAVNTAVARNGTLDDYLTFGGNVMAATSVNVMPKAAGKLVNIRVSVGDKVRYNQVLMDVDPSQPGMTYALSPVKAPISGTITLVPYDAGNTVSQSMAVTQIATTNKLQVEIYVAERFVSRVKMGQNAELSFDAYPGESFPAKVTEVSPVLDTTSRTKEVKLTITDNPNNKIQIGMYARVKLITDELHNIVIIPSGCPVERQGKTYVFVCDASSNMAHQIAIVPGTTVDALMEVKSGLHAGDLVVSSGQTLLSDGSKVNILTKQNTTPGSENSTQNTAGSTAANDADETVSGGDD